MLASPSYRTEKKQANENNPTSVSSAVAAKRKLHAQQQNDKHKKLLEEKVWQGSVVRKIVNEDPAWNSAIFCLPPSLLKFGVNAIINTLPSRNNLKRWKLISDDACTLCQNGQTIQHVLSFCKPALVSGRFTWRHNTVLKPIADYLRSRLPSSTFVYVDDLPDYKYDQPFLQTIHESTLRPDIVLVEKKSKTFVMIELSCPDDENMNQRRKAKQEKYAILVQNATANLWSTQLHTIEVSTRGFHNGSLRNTLSAIDAHWKLPHTKSDLSTMCAITSELCLHASYFIWLCRNITSFNHPPTLLPSQSLPKLRPKVTLMLARVEGELVPPHQRSC